MTKVRNYTDEELEYIKKEYNSKTFKQLAEELNKKESSVYNAIRKLGLKKQTHNEWANEEIEFLKSNYINMTSEEISHYVNHSIDSINTMRDRLRLVRNKEWSNEDIEYLKNNFESTLFCDLSKVLGRTEGAIRTKCFDLGLLKTSPWTDDEIEFVKKNYMEMPTSEIAEILCRTSSAVQIHARRLGLKKYPYMCDYHYFDNIDTEEKAYWLGFLSADGWININEKSNAGVIGIELQYSDIGHLKKFNKSISGNYKITDRWKTCPISTKDSYKKHHMCMIRIFSLTMYNTLDKLGFENDKSYSFSIPKLRKDLIRHYIRGYFDGDGCFTLTDKSFNIKFVTASNRLKNDVVDILKSENIYITEYGYISKFETEMFGINIYRNKDKIKFLNWIYEDCKIYLDRKYKKYLKVKNNNKNTQSLAV